MAFASAALLSDPNYLQKLQAMAAAPVPAPPPASPPPPAPPVPQPGSSLPQWAQSGQMAGTAAPQPNPTSQGSALPAWAQSGVAAGTGQPATPPAPTPSPQASPAIDVGDAKMDQGAWDMPPQADTTPLPKQRADVGLPPVSSTAVMDPYAGGATPQQQMQTGAGSSISNANAPQQGYSFDKDKFLDAVVQPESGNQNVVTSLKNPDGSPGTASGFWQITNGTWREFAPKAGVDLSQYPTAVSAPKAVQRAVAGAVYDGQGPGAWDTFNKGKVPGFSPNGANAVAGGTNTAPSGAASPAQPGNSTSSFGPGYDQTMQNYQNVINGAVGRLQAFQPPQYSPAQQALGAAWGTLGGRTMAEGNQLAGRNVMDMQQFNMEGPYKAAQMNAQLADIGLKGMGQTNEMAMNQARLGMEQNQLGIQNKRLDQQIGYQNAVLGLRTNDQQNRASGAYAAGSAMGKNDTKVTAEALDDKTYTGAMQDLNNVHTMQSIAQQYPQMFGPSIATQARQSIALRLGGDATASLQAYEKAATQLQGESMEALSGGHMASVMRAEGAQKMWSKAAASASTDPAAMNYVTNLAAWRANGELAVRQALKANYAQNGGRGATGVEAQAAEDYAAQNPMPQWAGAGSAKGASDSAAAAAPGNRPPLSSFQH